MSYTQQQWISIIAPLAVAEYKRQQAIAKGRGYLPSVIIAQTICETGYGNDSIYVKYNNILGMKSGLLNGTWDTVWSGDSIVGDTIEEYTKGTITHIQDAFRIYSSFEQCLHDYCQFMNGRKYSGVTNTSDPRELITRVKNKGYATADTYIDSVMDIIIRHGLTVYDTEAKNGVTYPVIDKRSYLDSRGQYIDRTNTHQFIAMHYLGVPGGQNYNLYNGRYGGHATIYLDGTVYMRVPDDGLIWHVGASAGYSYKHPTARNNNTFGIEMCVYCDGVGNANETNWYFSQATQQAAVQFVRRKFTEWGWPLTKENIDKRLLRHGDITTKICPNPWIKSIGYKTNWTWEQFKEAVRTGVCPNATSDEDTIKELQARFIAVGFGMGCKKGKPDGDWGKTSKSDCKRFCKLYALNEVEYPDDAVLKKLEEVEKVNNPLVFDWEYYLKKNKDLKEADITEQADALAHFVMNGIKEGNRPSSPTFSLPYYTKKYKDLASLDNLGKVYHFMSNGIYEGRRASSEFNLYKYYGNYEDLREAFGLLYTDGEIDAKLVRKNGPKYYDHFVTYGYKEGRTANKKI